jgi:methylphosphotriester-DNA--protein-cysteine methyltransferase
LRKKAAAGSAMAFNLTPEQIRLAQQQMSNMSPEQIAAQFQNMTPAQKLQAQQMGLDPSMIDMMSKNPEMMKQAANQFKNMTPEQVKAAQEMVW